MSEYKIEGMTCGHCVRAVEGAIRAADPAAQVQVDLETGRAVVQGGTAPAERIVEAVAAEGYTAAPVR